MTILFSIFVTFYCYQSKKWLLQGTLKKEEAQEVAASLAAATGFSMNAAKVARIELKAFSLEKTFSYYSRLVLAKL